MVLPKKVLILGGDGFVGWPLALSLSKRGDEVIIVDNMLRRDIDKELGVQSLTPICSIEERITAWEELTGKKIRFHKLDVSADFDSLLELIRAEEPSTIVDLAKIKSAPYSMRSPKHRRRTLDNNLGGCETVLSAILESGLDIHLVHIGTMGVYGYNPPTSEALPEGYITVKVPENDPDNQGTQKLVDWEILYPASPGSVYHLTKTQEALHFQLYNRLHGIRITDLHQGVVWGTETPETSLDSRLVNRFDYDGDYGTILNRFLIQGALGYPLTVYGTGGQTRAFIHIKDCVQCLTLAMDNPPKKGERVHIYNQATQCLKVIDLANLVSRLADSQIDFLPNPRKELPKNELDVVNSTLLGLGLEPTLLSESLSVELIQVAKKYQDRADLQKIAPVVLWNKRQSSEPSSTESPPALVSAPAL